MKFTDLPEVHQNLVGYLFDPACPTSLAALLPEKLVSRLLELLAPDHEAMTLLPDEEQLTDHLDKKYGYKRPGADERLRVSFWMEYERALNQGDRMIVGNIHNLVCDERSFYRVFLARSAPAIFLCSRPTEYQAHVRELLGHGLRQLRKILDMPVEDPKTGKLNMKMLELKTRITAMMDMRVHGAPTQKVQQLNLNVDAGKKEMAAMVSKVAKTGDMLAIRQRLKELEDLEKKAADSVMEPEVVTVEVVESKN